MTSTQQENERLKIIDQYLTTRHRLYHMGKMHPVATGFDEPISFEMSGIIFGNEYKPATNNLTGKVLYVNLLKTQDHWCGATSDIDIWSYYLRYQNGNNLLREWVTNPTGIISSSVIPEKLEEIMSLAEKSGFKVISPNAKIIWAEDNHAEFISIVDLDKKRKNLETQPAINSLEGKANVYNSTQQVEGKN